MSLRTSPLAVPPRIDWTSPWMSISAVPARSVRKFPLKRGDEIGISQGERPARAERRRIVERDGVGTLGDAGHQGEAAVHVAQGLADLARVWGGLAR